MITYKRILNKNFIKNSKSTFLDDFIGNRKHFFASSGRGGIEACIDLINLKNNDYALLPALSPEGIVIPFNRKKNKIIYYKVNKLLIPDMIDIASKIKNFNIKVIVIIHYFGFPQPIDDLKNEIKNLKEDIYIIEDCAQAFLSKYKNGEPIGSVGDISFFSFPKFLPVPDGSLFIVNNHNIKIEKLKYCFSFLHKISLLSHILFIKLKTNQIKIKNLKLYDILNFLLKIIYFIYYKCISLQKNPVNISKYSKNLLYKCDLQKFINKRVENTNYIFQNIDRTKYTLLFDHYNSYLITGFPILISNKERFQSILKKQKIETLAYKRSWFNYNKGEKQNFLNEMEIYKKLLLIPINETISNKQIRHLVNVLNNFDLNKIN